MHPVPSLIQPPIKIENNKLSPNFTFSTANSRFYNPMNHLPPSPTQTKSSVSTDASSECLISPQSTGDGGGGRGVSVGTPTPLPPNAQQSGLLEILMSPDKCQVMVMVE
jgi:nuclear receptor subfamily 2 group A